MLAKSGPALCSLANEKDLNYLASVGAALRAVFCEITRNKHGRSTADGNVGGGGAAW